jgi:hypothetical protein
VHGDSHLAHAQGGDEQWREGAMAAAAQQDDWTLRSVRPGGNLDVHVELE